MFMVIKDVAAMHLISTACPAQGIRPNRDAHYENFANPFKTPAHPAH
jgi:hypothetical protein